MDRVTFLDIVDELGLCDKIAKGRHRSVSVLSNTMNKRNGPPYLDSTGCKSTDNVELHESNPTRRGILLVANPSKEYCKLDSGPHEVHPCRAQHYI